MTIQRIRVRFERLDQQRLGRCHVSFGRERDGPRIVTSGFAGASCRARLNRCAAGKPDA